MVYTIGEYADVAWGADNVHAFGGVEVAVEVGEDEEFAAACADFLHIGFHFVQQAVVPGQSRQQACSRPPRPTDRVSAHPQDKLRRGYR